MKIELQNTIQPNLITINKELVKNKYNECKQFYKIVLDGELVNNVYDYKQIFKIEKLLEDCLVKHIIETSIIESNLLKYQISEIENKNYHINSYNPNGYNSKYEPYFVIDFLKINHLYNGKRDYGRNGRISSYNMIISGKAKHSELNDDILPFVIEFGCGEILENLINEFLTYHFGKIINPYPLNN